MTHEQQKHLHEIGMPPEKDDTLPDARTIPEYSNVEDSLAPLIVRDKVVVWQS
jgi:hypothetical protein